MMFMTLTFMEKKPEKQQLHGSRTDRSRKQREKTERQRPGERKRRRRERASASAWVFPGPQGRPPLWALLSVYPAGLSQTTPADKV